MGECILILGGARSGKSTFAERLARELGGDSVLFVATAEALDEEMRQRIEAHRRARPATWRTLEAPRRVGAAVQSAYRGERVVLLDCVTMLVANVLSAQPDPSDPAAADAVWEEIHPLLSAFAAIPATAILVSNEVGLGLVPATPLGRAYRDLLGQVNQALAAQATQVYFLVAGIPVKIKG